MDQKELNQEFLDSLLQGDFRKCQKIVNSYIADQHNITELYEFIFKENLYKVGDLWEFNKISVAEEHIATSVVEAIMSGMFYDIISKERIQKSVIITSIEGEQHQIGSKMVADIFEKNGWDAFFLGANTPTRELISFIHKKKPDVVALSISIFFNMNVLEETLETLTIEFPELKILVGGQAFRHGGVKILDKFQNVSFMHDLNDLEEFLQSNNKLY
ncbi:MAG: cobalamin-dependent protein [Bacteroidales bacterium]|nr:cobalamin-dependent protein [Bacteroidales bacterium]